MTRLTIANVWLLETGSGPPFLVDTSHPLERPLLARSLRRAGIDRLAGVLLTHRHSDHAGNAAWLRDRYRCPVVCHPEDTPYLEGRATPPRLARGVAFAPFELLCRIEDRWPARTPVDDVYTPGRWRDDWEVFHAPGHTEGSSMLYHAPTGTLFSGDVLLSGVAPFRRWVRPGLAVAAFSLDAETCHAHVRRWLAGAPPLHALCAGHGPALVGDVAGTLSRLRAG
ncbi:MAG: MBL fold metallo-hydrolase [Myxococcota bacterium]